MYSAKLGCDVWTDNVGEFKFNGLSNYWVIILTLLPLKWTAERNMGAEGLVTVNTEGRIWSKSKFSLVAEKIFSLWNGNRSVEESGKRSSK